MFLYDGSFYNINLASYLYATHKDIRVEDASGDDWFLIYCESKENGILPQDLMRKLHGAMRSKEAVFDLTQFGAYVDPECYRPTRRE